MIARRRKGISFAIRIRPSANYNETFISRGPALRKPRKSMNSFIPRPVFADTRSTCIPGRTAWIFASAVGSSKSTACERSILVSTATSALLKIVGYFRGLSSPSVTDVSTRRKFSPKS